MRKILFLITTFALAFCKTTDAASKCGSNLNNWVYYHGQDNQPEIDLFGYQNFPIPSGWYKKTQMQFIHNNVYVPKEGAKPLSNTCLICQLQKAAECRTLQEERKMHLLAQRREKIRLKNVDQRARAAIYPPTQPKKK